MFLTLISVAVSCFGCYGLIYLLMWHSNRQNLYKLASRLKGPPVLPILGNAHLMIGGGEKFLSKLEEWDRLYHSLYRFWLGPSLFVLVNDPEQIKMICNNPLTVDKGEYFNMFFEPHLGEGLLTAPASKWRAHRKLIQPTFNKRILDTYVKSFASQAQIFTEEIERNLDGPEFEIFKLLSVCTLDMVCESVMGVNIGAQTDRNCHFARAQQQTLASAGERLFTFWQSPDFIFYRTNNGKTFRKSVKYLRDIADNVIKTKKNELRERNSGQPALVHDAGRACNPTPRIETSLDHLLELAGDAGELSDQDIRDEVNTIIAAGSDTTATTISFIMLMLASRPDVQDKVYQELYEIYGNADSNERPVMPEDLRLMKYSERVIKETLRLFPTAAFVVRQVTKDLNLGGHTLPKGAYTLIGIRSPQRNEKYWPNPLKFEPDRFLPEEVAKRHPYSFMAFSGGPRNCIGMNYAMMSMKTVIATVLRRYVLKKDDIVPIEDIRVTMEILLKPVIPITLRIERRPNN